MPRAIADLTLSFGLVSIPVRLYPATQSKADIHFNLLHKTCGSRLRQQYTCIKEDVVVERSEMVKGYEVADDQYVVFTPEELKALEEKGTHSVDIVAFIPVASVDPIYYDKAYYLAPDKRGGKPYALLLQGMQKTGRCALARWVWRGKSYTVQVRVSPEGGLVLQQLLYGEEVRSISDLSIEPESIKAPELDLAVQLINQIATDSYDPNEFQDDAKKRIEAAIDEKVSGKQVTVSEEPQHQGAKVIDLMEALRASLSATPPAASKTASKAAPKAASKAAKRAPAAAKKAPAAAKSPRARKSA
jgi:DNA end-binding protein Ku